MGREGGKMVMQSDFISECGCYLIKFLFEQYFDVNSGKSLRAMFCSAGVVP